jgi:preprotein translocase subunit SecD
VLTVGIAVDSNVLIYERIREELRGGRTAISAIDAGFKRALSTILDSNITTFIAAAVLFYVGTGPVRGFAVTLGLGIVTTVFTAFTLTRLIVAMWVRWWRPKTVPI